MNPILIHFLSAAEDKGILVQGLICFWWFVIMPMTISALFVEQFNIIFDKAIAQVNDAFPRLVNHWKNPFYHCYIMIAALARMVFLPMNLLLAFVDGRKDWWRCL